MNRQIKCAVLEDEAPARRLLCQYISLLPQKLILTGTFSNPKAFSDLDSLDEIELLFLDLKMPGNHGFEMLGRLNNQPEVIVVTAYQEFALQGYFYNLIDYILKPISFERFIHAVDKAIERIRIKRLSNVEHALIDDFIWIKSDRKLHKVFTHKIEYIESSKEFLIIHTLDKRYILRTSFDHILEQLPNDRFVQIHKSYVIPIDQIQSFNKSEVYLPNISLPIGLKFRKPFFHALKLETT